MAICIVSPWLLGRVGFAASGHGDLKAVLVLTGADPEPPLEGAAHHLGAAEAAAARDLLEALAAVLQEGPGALDAGALDVVGRRGPELAAEPARELALGEMQSGGEAGDGKILTEMFCDPRLQLLQ